MPDILQDLQYYCQTFILLLTQDLRNEVDDLLVKPPISEKHLTAIHILTDVKEESQHVDHELFIEQQGLYISIHQS